MTDDSKSYEWHFVQFYLGVPAGTTVPLEDFGTKFFDWLAGPDEKTVDSLHIDGIVFSGSEKR